MLENGLQAKLAENMSGLALTDSSPFSSSSNFNSNIHGSNGPAMSAATTPTGSSNNGNLFQVMKAIDAAEATIKQQVEENYRLKTELHKRIEELEQLKLHGRRVQRPHSIDPWNEQAHGPYEVHQSVPSIVNQEDKVKSVANASVADPTGTMVLRPDLKIEGGDPAIQRHHLGSHSESSNINGMLKVLPGCQAPIDSSGLSQFPSPSTASFPSNRCQMEGELGQRFNLSVHGVMQMAEGNNPNSLWKQIQEHEEEILQLKKHLSDFSIKEAQIRNEKYVLEKRIAYMRLAFDKQQQDLVDAAAKALSYRQDIMEENIRLTYELQAAQQEISIFVSFLMPLLAEYSLQPPVPDAQSIVSNLRVLFRHLQEKLIHTESKLKESQYQLAPWHSEANNPEVNHSNFAPQSPAHSILTTLNKNGLELVPQPTYSQGQMPISSSDVQKPTDWDPLSHRQSGLGGAAAKNMESEDVVRYPHLASRNSSAHDASLQFAASRVDAQAVHYGEETTNKRVIFRDPVSSSEMDDADGQQNEGEPSSNWGSGSSPYPTPLDDPSSSYSPYLDPVLEEPSSSFSEAADDDALPAIEGLQISGEAFPGRELQACGYSINGTTSCNFEWVRHLEDGSVNYIEGAKQPNYLVTADDVGTYLAIEVQPLDDRKRKGELVKVFANDHRKITCDNEMQNYIEKTLYSGHASFKVTLATRYLDMWEPATLAIKREAYSIKCSSTMVTEKFSSTANVLIPYGEGTEFTIVNSSGVEHHLRVDDHLTDVSCSRDTIVLTLRLFILRAGDKRKGKRRGIFFNK